MYYNSRKQNFSVLSTAYDHQCLLGHLSTTSFTNWNSTRSLRLLPREINDGSDRYSFKVDRDKTRVSCWHVKRAARSTPHVEVLVLRVHQLSVSLFVCFFFFLFFSQPPLLSHFASLFG